MKQFFQAAKRPSGPKDLLFVLLFALLGLNLSAQGLWPSPIPSPLFPPLPGLVLPQAQPDDGQTRQTTVGEMRLALTYYNGYNNLYKFVTTVIIPESEQVVDKYNKLLRRYNTVIDIGTTVGIVLILATLYMGYAR